MCGQVPRPGLLFATVAFSETRVEEPAADEPDNYKKINNNNKKKKSMCIYIYIERERAREREIDR